MKLQKINNFLYCKLYKLYKLNDMDKTVLPNKKLYEYLHVIFGSLERNFVMSL